VSCSKLRIINSPFMFMAKQMLVMIQWQVNILTARRHSVMSEEGPSTRAVVLFWFDLLLSSFNTTQLGISSLKIKRLQLAMMDSIEHRTFASGANKGPIVGFALGEGFMICSIVALYCKSISIPNTNVC
jgi:hypothetical protein